MIDVVIPLGKGSNHDNEELRYALRSIEKNVKDLGQVYIVTTRAPLWIKNVKIVRYPDVYKGNKDANMISKILHTIKTQPLTEDFIRMSDDQSILKEVSLESLYPIYNGIYKKGSTVKPEKEWAKRLKNTCMLFEDEKEVVYKYDSHAPMVYNGKLFSDTMRKHDWFFENTGYTINTLYFNSIEVERTVKAGSVVYIIKENEKELNEADLLKSMKEKASRKTFLSYNDSGYDKAMLLLQDLFPEPSKFEKDPNEIANVSVAINRELISAGMKELHDMSKGIYIDIYLKLLAREQHIDVTLKRIGIAGGKEIDEERKGIESMKQFIEKKYSVFEFNNFINERKLDNSKRPNT